mgnify:CR=1 FL=1
MAENQQKTLFDALMHEEKNKYTNWERTDTWQLNYFNWRNTTMPLYVPLQMDSGIYMVGSIEGPPIAEFDFDSAQQLFDKKCDPWN